MEQELAGRCAEQHFSTEESATVNSTTRVSFLQLLIASEHWILRHLYEGSGYRSGGHSHCGEVSIQTV